MSFQSLRSTHDTTRPKRGRRLTLSWAFLLVASLFLTSLELQSSPAGAQVAPEIDTGFEETSTRVSLEEPVSLELEPGTTMLIIEDAPEGAHFDVMSRNDGEWGAPIEIGSHGDEGPDETRLGEGAFAEPGLANIGPIWLGEDAEAVKVRTFLPIEVTLTTLRPTEAVEQTGPQVNGTRLSAGQPTIQPRSAWATSGWAYETSGCEDGPSTADVAKAVVIHHTVTSNSYSRSQVPEILRGMYHFHVNVNKWCDLGYNFVVDKYGTIWEGRSGGTDEAIIGGHARGFNTATSGIALLGQHERGANPAAASPTSASKTAIAKLAAWKLSLGDIAPTDRVSLTNASTSGAQKLTSGETHNLPAVLGHSDLGFTSCPGSLTATFVRELAGLASAYVSEFVDHSDYVNALSQTFDGRALRSNEVAYWQAITERDGLEGVAQKFVYSEANVGVAVDALYRSALRRNADSGGREHWVDALQRGTRYEQVALAFYGSPELAIKNPSNRQYVQRLYSAVLGRSADSAGLSYWEAKLRRGEFTRYQTASLFVRSAESRQLRVAALYLSILDRTARATELREWAPYLSSGDDFTLAAKLAASAEFSG